MERKIMMRLMTWNCGGHRRRALVAKLVVKMVSDMIDETSASPSSSTSTHRVSHCGLQKMWWGNVLTCWMSRMGDCLLLSEANLFIRILEKVIENARILYHKFYRLDLIHDLCLHSQAHE